VLVVFETAINKKSGAKNCAPIAIGFAVFVAVWQLSFASVPSSSMHGTQMMVTTKTRIMCVLMQHMVCIPVTGCSINPTRSFGPAVVAT
jgi:glycerol uptake facilitator-like aquaporin